MAADVGPAPAPPLAGAVQVGPVAPAARAEVDPEDPVDPEVLGEQAAPEAAVAASVALLRPEAALPAEQFSRCLGCAA